jgi:hypothetical protein
VKIQVLNVPVSKGKSFTSIEQIAAESFYFAPPVLYVFCPTINYLNERNVSSETILLCIGVIIFIGMKHFSSQILKTQEQILLSEHLPVILVYA